MIEGLRIIITNKCNRRCSFCYQNNFEDTLSIKDLDLILSKLNNKKYKYVTVMGGEIFTLQNYNEYLNIINYNFLNIKKSITTNGDLRVKHYIQKN